LYICDMVSVQAVYRTLQDLANKDQKGFITPAVFNRFAALAQINIYNELFQELVKAKQISRQNFDPGRDKSVRKQTLEDLSVFIVSDRLIQPVQDRQEGYRVQFGRPVQQKRNRNNLRSRKNR